MRGLAAHVAFVGVACALLAALASSASASGLVRVDQLGYPTTAPKSAVLMATRPARGARFEVVTATGRTVLRGRVRMAEGRWNTRYRYVYRLDLSAVRGAGRYRIVVPALHARSPLFRIAAAPSLYGQVAANAVRFFQAQRDGQAAAGAPLGRRASHLLDAQATVFATPSAAQLHSGHFRPTGATADVSGGWFDAGDYLKFVETTSFTDTLMLWAEREHPGAVPGLAAEARIGIDWLKHVYDPGSGRLVYQVGIGDGNGDKLLGDHDLWRLPQRDDSLRAGPGSPERYLKHRPAFATGAPLSPNLAGRTAAAFGLCAQVYRASDPAYADRCLADGEAIFAEARTTHVGRLLTVSPHAYYPETSWRDDMALGATELYRALQAAPDRSQFTHSNPAHYLGLAAHWADAYASGPGADFDSMNLYDVAALADYDLTRALQAPHPDASIPTDPGALESDLRDQLRIGTQTAARYPFGLANPNTWSDSVTHALGYSVTARLYDQLTHRHTYDAFAQHQLDWVLGANPWGSSFVVGAGTTFPRCLQHQVANLAGGLKGRGSLLLGATVGGPTGRSSLGPLGAPDGYRRCPAGGRDPFASLDGRGAVYRDDVRSAATSEPTDDATALALLAFAARLG